jgi:serine/threonine-protein kinase
VALKFLPPKLAEDSVRRERFFAEVRITRQLSHPNICRVYDIGEVDGRHFLSMEYIDGEDLASLMKRIGHLSNEKALDIARQLVAGLSVAHERGVLHRDLKPANIMLDGHGRVRITDFGLAIAAEDEAQAEEIAGTPAYMAPEQLEGKGATVRSDIYSLGLILYEIYTGKKAFKAKTLAELREQKETQTPRAPSELRDGIDPVVERVIQRCMEKDPGARTASVAQLAQALPGGDPLAAAIAAGETPSPEMVAASGSKEGLRPLVAWVCLALIILGIGVAVMLSQQANLFERVPVEMKPAALEQRARDILSDIGYSDSYIDSAFGFIVNEAYFKYIEENVQSPTRFENLPPFVIQFWYRQSPQPLEHLVVSVLSEGVNLSDPPLKNNGESVVWLDAHGNLIGLQIIPEEERQQPGTVPPPEWSLLFKAAGLDQDKFPEEVEPDWNYLSYSDERVAWVEKMPYLLSVPMRIDATAWQGKPISWRMTIPAWQNLLIPASPSSDSQWSVFNRVRTRMPFMCIGMAIIIFLARRNLRMGRGDRRGANRIAFFYFTLSGLVWLFAEHHIAASGEFYLLLHYAAIWLFIASLLWMAYIATEPFVRRHMPALLVGWSRLLAGNLRDPLVGRNILFGSIAGLVMILVSYLRYPLVSFFGAVQIRPSAVLLAMWESVGFGRSGTLYLLSGPHKVVASVLSILIGSAAIGLLMASFIIAYRLLFKRTWAAATMFIFTVTAVNSMRDLSFFYVIPLILLTGTALFVLLRFGALALMAQIFSFSLLLIFPITMRFSAWYFSLGFIGLVLLLAIAVYAFYTSLGGRPIFGTPRLED